MAGPPPGREPGGPYRELGRLERESDNTRGAKNSRGGAAGVTLKRIYSESVDKIAGDNSWPVEERDRT